MGMGALKALHQCLQLACARAEQGSAFSPSGVRHLQHAVGRLQQDREPSSSCLQDGPHKGRAPWPGQLPGGGLASWAPALLGGKAAVGRGALGGTAARGPSLLLPLAAAAAQPHQLRGLFGARQPAEPPPQVHTHAAYKRENPQPTYDFLQGRFVLDRNGAIWHKQGGYVHKRYAKTASRLTRLKRWKPLYGAYARKLVKLGFRERYWAPPEPADVPGFQKRGGAAAVRRCADADLRPDYGNPALRQSYRPPARGK